MNELNYASLDASKRLVILPDGPDDELWKDVTGYEGIYKVSTYGRVFSIKRTGNRKDRILVQFKTHKHLDYFSVDLHKDGGSKKFAAPNPITIHPGPSMTSSLILMV